MLFPLRNAPFPGSKGEYAPLNAVVNQWSYVFKGAIPLKGV